MNTWLDDNFTKEYDNDIAEMLNLVLVCLSKLPITKEIIRRTRVLIYTFLIIYRLVRQLIVLERILKLNAYNLKLVL